MDEAKLVLVQENAHVGGTDSIIMVIAKDRKDEVLLDCISSNISNMGLNVSF